MARFCGPARTLMLCWVLALLTSLSARGDTNAVQWSQYAWSEIGGSVIPKFNATLSSTLPGSIFSEDLKLTMSPGFAAHGGLGQRFLPWLSAEVEGGFYYNEVDEARFPGGQSRSFNGTLLQVPILLNVIFHLPDTHPVVPFAGAGVGARITWLDMNDSVSLGSAGVVRLDDSSVEASPAYQAFAGLRFNLQPDAAFMLIYRFNGGISPTWSLNDAVTGANVANLKAHDMFIHTLDIAFCVRF